MSLSIVVVSYNARPHLERCLRALQGIDGEQIVVDCASTDDSPLLVEERFPDVRLVALTRNVGYGAACNLGVGHTSGRYVLVLNADAWPAGNAIETLLAAVEGHPRAGALGPALVGTDGARRRSVFAYPVRPMALAAWLTAPALASAAYGRWQRVRDNVRRVGTHGRATGGARHAAATTAEHEFLGGAALLLRRAAFEAVGGFDESFFLFAEDVDLCHRLRRARWDIVFVPEATFVHVGGASWRAQADAAYVQQVRSHLRYVAKWSSARETKRAYQLAVAALRWRARVGARAARRKYALAAASLSARAPLAHEAMGEPSSP